MCAEFCCHLDDKTDQNRCRRLVSDVKQSIQLKRQIFKHPIYSKITFKVSADFENVTHGRAHLCEERALLLLRVGVQVKARSGHEGIFIN